MFNSYQVESKTFQQLSAQELYAILALRLEVFCVEQNCPYQDIDFEDQQAQHVFIAKDESVIAYARITHNQKSGHHHIGRVVVDEDHRQHKLATKIMQHCIDVVRALPAQGSNSKTIVISSQSYLQNFYRSLGFVSMHDYYLEDDIPHERMELKLN